MRLAWFGFETGDLKQCASTAGTVTADSAVKRTGTYSLKIAGSGSNQNYVVLKAETGHGQPTAGFDAAELWLTGFFRVSTAPTAAAENVLVVRDSSNSALLSVRLSSNRTLDIYDSAGALVAAGTTALALDTFTRIQLRLLAVEPGSYTLLVGSNLESSGAIDAGAEGSTIDHFVLGNPTSAGSTAFTVYFDDLVIDDAEFNGDTAILRLPPVSNGADTAWANDYAAVDEVPANSTDYVTSTVTDQKESVRVQSPTTAGMPGGAKILGLKYSIVTRRVGIPATGNPPWALYAKSNGVVDWKYNPPFLAAASTFETRTLSHPFDFGNQDAAWTSAAIAAMDVGAHDGRSGETATLQCTMMMAEVLYRTDFPGSAALTGTGTATAGAAIVSQGEGTATGSGAAALTPQVTSQGVPLSATGLGTAQSTAAVEISGTATATARGLASAQAVATAVASGCATGIGSAACALLQVLEAMIRHFLSLSVAPVHVSSRSLARAHAATRSVRMADVRTCSGREN